MSEEKQILFEKDELARTLNRMAHEVIEKTPHANDLVLIGIRSRGDYLARRMARKIQELSKVTVPVGVIDVTPYRDDRAHEQDARTVSAFAVQVAVDDKTVVLIDDVIFRGRTIRAAMEAVALMGQPKRILVAVLLDRGARELPIRADVVGKNVEAEEGERVNVLLEESDGVDQVSITRWHTRRAI